MMGDPAVAAPLGHDAPVDPPRAWRDMAFLAGHWALKGYGHWVLEKLDTGECVGRAGLLRPPGWPDLEVGWTVAREHWGKGYAPEAARAACEWAHDELGAPHIVSLIEPVEPELHPRGGEARRAARGRAHFHAAAGSFDLLVYGADLPLAGSS